MRGSRRDLFTTVKSEGGLLPADFLQRLIGGGDGIEGLSPDAYHLPGGEKLNEAASRSWNRMLGAWGAFQAASKDLKESDAGTGVTREKWLLALFQELGYGRLLAAKTFDVEGKSYPISHVWNRTPIHLVGRNVDLDRRSPGVVGAANVSPHGLVQEFLNRSSEHLWGFLSNGLQLRILRESKSLTRQAYVEFDLAGMMEGQVYADFALLWLLCHQSRVEADRPEQSWLERWSEAARAQGTRALEDLRKGVEKAIEALGRGFLAYRGNAGLREILQSGGLAKQDYYRQLLRTVYRLIFLFVAEDRDLLLTARPGAAERDWYLRFYSADRLRTLAERRRGSPHADLWQGLRVVFQKLSSESGCPELGLPALGSFLWSAKATPDLDGCDLANSDLLDTVRALAFIVDRGIRRGIDYKNLGAEELGSVYESLLELHPDVNAAAATFALTTAAGHERKTTGSYYTPTSLIECLLDSALEPVLDEAAKKPDPEKAILNLKVCDPACGSGHFLIAAAHRIANRLAAVRTGDEEPPPEAVRRAMRDVVGRCLYGVDLNPMAVELCKVNLWIEALEPGRPLSFLDHRIQCGNSLLGTTPALLKTGIPDEAFDPIEGDDKEYCKKFKKENKKERIGQLRLIEHKWEPWQRLGSLATAIVELDAISDETVQGQLAKQERWEQLVRSSGYEFGRLLADAWCAAFVWKKHPDPVLQYPITEDTFRRIERNPHWAPAWMKEEVHRLAEGYQFFHWHLAFPDVFRVPVSDDEEPKEESGWLGGFDVILGNPPWDQVHFDDREFFASDFPEIAKAANMSKRKKLVEELAQRDPELYEKYSSANRSVGGAKHFVHASGRYPYTSYGRLNLAPLFVELSRAIVALRGRVGVIVPSGIAFDSFNQYFFRDMIDSQSLCSLYEFENEGFFIGAGQGHMNRFCLLTLAGKANPNPEADLLFQGHDISELRNEARRFNLTAEDFALVNPNTRTCPIFRTKQDAALAKFIYRRVPVLLNQQLEGKGDPWGFTGLLMFMMNTDSVLFRNRSELESDKWMLRGNIFKKAERQYLPLYEGKMVYQYNHRHGDHRKLSATERAHVLPEVSHAELSDPNYCALPHYWLPTEAVEERLRNRWDHNWLIGWRDVTDARASARTVVASVLPRAGVGHKLPLALVKQTAENAACFLSNLAGFVLDYVARQKVGGLALTLFTFKQLPILPPPTYSQPCPWSGGAQTLRNWLMPRVLELTYTAWDLEPFAQDCGWLGPPFRWDEERRFLLRCELDAAFFHLYLGPEDEWRRQPETFTCAFLNPRQAVDYIMDTFPIVKRRDEEKYGDYRTKLLILDIYDRMQEAIATGRPYETILSPPPADPSVAHGVTKQ